MGSREDDIAMQTELKSEDSVSSEMKQNRTSQRLQIEYSTKQDKAAEQHQVEESEMIIGDETNEQIRHCSRTQTYEQNEALTDDSALDLEGNGDNADCMIEDYEESLPR